MFETLRGTRPTSGPPGAGNFKRLPLLSPVFGALKLAVIEEVLIFLVINCYQVQQLPSTPTASGYLHVRIRIEIRNKMGPHVGAVGSGTALQSKRHWNFTLTKSFRPHYGSGFDSFSNRNEY